MLRTIVSTPVRLVDLTERLACPETFRAVVDGDDEPFVAEIEFRVMDGAVRCVSFCAHAPDGRYLTVVELRDRVALKRWTTLATASVVFEKVDGGYELPDTVSHRDVRLPSRTRSTLSDTARLQEVAKVYAEALSDGSRGPVREVSRTLHYSPAHAQRLVNEARRQGLIEGDES